MATLSYASIKSIAFDALQNSTELNDWCLRNYGRQVAVVNDLDPMEPPKAEDCPLVGIATLGGSTGQDESEYVRAFTVRVAIQDGRLDERRDANGRLLSRDYAGSDAVTHMLENIIYPVLCDAFNARNFPLSATEETIEATGLDLFQAKAGLTVKMDKAIGERVPLLG